MSTDSPVDHQTAGNNVVPNTSSGRRFPSTLRIWPVLGLVACFTALALGQSSIPPKGAPEARRKNWHSGNQVRTSFYNYGMVGREFDDPLDIGGEWPINSGHTYIGDVSILAGTEIVDVNGDTLPSVVVSDGPRGGNETAPDGTFWGWEPLAGFASPDTELVAMSHQKYTWPAQWPDKLTDPKDPGWSGSWNGYFGKNQFNADQESYFIMDDGRDAEFNYWPATFDSTRRGLGFQAGVRGLQWSQVLAEDVLFWIFDISNVGTSNHEQVAFGMIVGTITGALNNHGDSEDDLADFIKEDNMTYSYDYNNIGAGGWSPVGYAGYAFLESPGNAVDGIDNDGDGGLVDGAVLTEEMILKVTATTPGEPVVVIHYDNDYEREIVTFPSDALVVSYRGRDHVFQSNRIYEEIPRNGFDDDLDGLIDENNGFQEELTGGAVYTYYLNEGFLTKDWFGGAGLTNLLIDEARDDNIDNDGDWNIKTDDVGLDGAPGTLDVGEDDGIPTSGRGTEFPGEPNFDKTDIDESDQIGLSSFYFFHFSGGPALKNDARLWSVMYPGYLNNLQGVGDTDFLFSSGYVPIGPGKIERFSTALVFGVDLADIVRNKQTVQTIYNLNYNFAKAPLLPILKAYAGDGEVILMWDKTAEGSYDRISGYDFEGYKIYRATVPNFDDAGIVTDAYGTSKFHVPVAQYDLDNEYDGFFPIGFDGAQFQLGSNTGLVHMYRDTTVINGVRYFYAVTAYDHGEEARQIIPSETSKFATIDKLNRIQTAPNVVTVVPSAPSAGYVPPPDFGDAVPSGNVLGTGSISVRYLNPREIQDAHTYEIRFLDQTNNLVDDDGDWVRRYDLNGDGALDSSEVVHDVGADGIGPHIWTYNAADSTWSAVPDPAYAGPDEGENDGLPTEGEPNLDALDPDEFRPVTTHYTVFDITEDPDGIQVLDWVEDFNSDASIFDGLQLLLENDTTNVHNSISGYHQYYPNRYNFSTAPFKFSGIATRGVRFPRDIQIVFDDSVRYQGLELKVVRNNGTIAVLPPKAANFHVRDPFTGDSLLFVFQDNTPTPTKEIKNQAGEVIRVDTSSITGGYLSANDRVHILEPVTGDTFRVTWSITFTGDDYYNRSWYDTINSAGVPGFYISDPGGYYADHQLLAGDTLTIRMKKPFHRQDGFHFTVQGGSVDSRRIETDLDRVMVVPNPYIVSSSFEPRNIYSDGRGDRAIHFNHLPADCVIRIYTLTGELVDILYHDDPADDGTAVWDLQTRDDLEIAYGLYLFHVEPAAGSGVDFKPILGKFAVIK